MTKNQSTARHPWTVGDIPEQQGRSIVVTGANSGIGYEAALVLAGKGARVILAVRNIEKGNSAADKIRRTYPSAAVQVLPLDLSDLRSVHGFAERYQQEFPALSVLINNAGVMALPYRRTVNGFEMQFGTNHLGHFALTGLLLPSLLATPSARIVTVSSYNHNFGAIDLSNLDGSRRYGRWSAYNQSKLANLLFAYELQRRLAASGADVISIACHPGYAATNLQSGGPRMDGSRLSETFWSVMNLFAQNAAGGALPLLYAATSPEARGGDYIGPTSMFGLRGSPARVRSHPRSSDEAMARRLWQVSEELTGVHYPFPSLQIRPPEPS